jgi:DNA polymerase-1
VPAPVLLLDTYSLLFRAFYALPAICTSTGVPTGALYGTSVLLLKLLREQAPAGLALALDMPAETFRRALYPVYKASRPSTPGDLAAQLAELPALIQALGAPAFGVPGFEADDVLATLARELSAGAQPVCIVTGDRDLLQLATDGVEILFVGQRGRAHVRYDVAAVEARFGVPPARLPSYVALVGDPSDDIPGVPGVGAKTAARWVRDHEDIAGVLASIDALAPAKLRPVIAEHADQLRLSEQLARLRSDVPLGPGPRHTGFDDEARARLRALFERFEFRSLLARLDGVPVAASLTTPTSAAR